MSLTDGSGLSASDVLALTANNNDGFGGNGFGGGWWLILFIIMMFGGWGNLGNAGAGNGVANMAVPYMLGQNSEVQRGFDQSAVMNGLNNLSMAVAQGFAAQSVDSCNKAMTIMQGQNGILQQMANDRFNTITTLNGGHNSILNQMANYEMARQQNQFIAANNQMQTDTIMSFLNPPYARPFPPTTTATAAG